MLKITQKKLDDSLEKWATNVENNTKKLDDWIDKNFPQKPKIKFTDEFDVKNYYRDNILNLYHDSIQKRFQSNVGEDELFNLEFLDPPKIDFKSREDEEFPISIRVRGRIYAKTAFGDVYSNDMVFTVETNWYGDTRNATLSLK